MAGNRRDRTRHSACHKDRVTEKKTAGLPPVRVQYHLPAVNDAHSKNVSGEKSVKAASGVSVAKRGIPAARRRDRNRSACQSVRSYALCVAPPRGPLAQAAPASNAPSFSRRLATHASHGRPRFPAVGRPWPQHGRISSDLRSTASASKAFGSDAQVHTLPAYFGITKQPYPK